MYGIYANIGGILMVNVTIYSIHGSYGYHQGKSLQIGNQLVLLLRRPPRRRELLLTITILYCILCKYRQSRPIMWSYTSRIIWWEHHHNQHQHVCWVMLSHPLPRSAILEIQSDLVLPLMCPQKGADRGPNVMMPWVPWKATWCHLNLRLRSSTSTRSTTSIAASHFLFRPCRPWWAESRIMSWKRCMDSHQQRLYFKKLGKFMKVCLRCLQ